VPIHAVSATVTTPDTMSYNLWPPAALVPGGHEIRVLFGAPVASNISHVRRVRVELVNKFGQPFRAQFAQFVWRLTGGTTATHHRVVNLRVILGGED
jgi:hypothetical protein